MNNKAKRKEVITGNLMGKRREADVPKERKKERESRHLLGAKDMDFRLQEICMGTDTKKYSPSHLLAWHLLLGGMTFCHHD
jgi:hypothetical protein